MTDNTEALPPLPDKWCLFCDKAGHQSHECWSTYGDNTPRSNELLRLAAREPRQQVPEGCAIDIMSSRVCQRGTKSCTADHALTAAPSVQAEPRVSSEQWKSMEDISRRIVELADCADKRRQRLGLDNAQTEPQCTRSHPHEDMSQACEALTIKARADNKAAQAEPQEPPAQQQSAQPEQSKTGLAGNYGATFRRCEAVSSMTLSTPPIATQPRAVEPLTDEQCDRIYEALHVFATTVDENDFGLPFVAGGGKEAGREVIRGALSDIGKP